MKRLWRETRRASHVQDEQSEHGGRQRHRDRKQHDSGDQPLEGNQSVGGAKGTPWVGARESGYGFHSSVEGHRQFTQTRVLSQPR